MDDVKRSVVISAEQDDYLNELRRRFGFTRSHGIRMALERFIANPPPFLADDLAESKETVHSGKIAEVA